MQEEMSTRSVGHLLSIYTHLFQLYKLLSHIKQHLFKLLVPLLQLLALDLLRNSTAHRCKLSMECM